MAPRTDDDWSDSDDEDLSDIETNVQLGLPDGPLESPEDLLDARVSRIGGHPVCAQVMYSPNVSSLSISSFRNPSMPSGVSQGPSAHRFRPVQGLWRAHVAPHTSLVSYGRKPERSCALCMGVLSRVMPEEGWQVSSLCVTSSASSNIGSTLPVASVHGDNCDITRSMRKS